MELSNDLLKKTIHEYLTVYCIQDGQTKGTIRGKEELFKKLLTFLNGKPFNLESVKAFQEYLHKRNWKKDSSKDCLARRLRALVNYCFEQELFEKNWAKKIVKPRLHRQVIEVVSEAVAMQIIISGTTPESFENAHSRRSKAETRLACEFMLHTGCRVHEVELMKGTDLRLDAPDPYVIIHSKGGDVEMQALPEIMMPILRERVDSDRLFFFTSKGANTVLRRGSKKLGIKNIKTTCHRLRDIFALTRLRNTSLTDVEAVKKEIEAIIIEIVSEEIKFRVMKRIHSYTVRIKGISIEEVKQSLEEEIVKVRQLLPSDEKLTEIVQLSTQEVDQIIKKGQAKEFFRGKEILKKLYSKFVQPTNIPYPKFCYELAEIIARTGKVSDLLNPIFDNLDQ